MRILGSLVDVQGMTLLAISYIAHISGSNRENLSNGSWMFVVSIMRVICLVIIYAVNRRSITYYVLCSES